MNKDNIKQYTYYIIIGIVSLFSLVFLPLLSSSVDAGWNYPSDSVGRVIWWTTKISVSILNVIIFHSFMQQAKVNIAKDPKYIEANEMLSRIRIKIYKPRSPQKWNAEQYSTKGVMILIMTLLGLIAFTQAILTFDYVSMFSYLFTIVMGIIFGLLQMKKAELYWTTEYYDYAKKVENKIKGEQDV